MTKPRYVWRLAVQYPKGSHQPGWQPEGWDEPMRGPFRWPAVRDFLSQRAAYNRAFLLEGFGAKVEIFRSLPVQFSTVPMWRSHPEEDRIEVDPEVERRGLLALQRALDKLGGMPIAGETFCGRCHGGTEAFEAAGCHPEDGLRSAQLGGDGA